CSPSSFVQERTIAILGSGGIFGSESATVLASIIKSPLKQFLARARVPIRHEASEGTPGLRLVREPDPRPAAQPPPITRLAYAQVLSGLAPNFRRDDPH